MHERSANQRTSAQSILQLKTAVVQLRTASDDRSIFGLERSGDVHVWTAYASRVDETATMHAFDGKAIALALSRDGALLAVGGEDGFIVRRTDDGNVLRTVHLKGFVTALAFVPSGDAILSVGIDERLRLVDLRTGEIQAQAIAGERNSSIALAPDGDKVALTSSWQGGAEVQFFHLRNLLTPLEDWLIGLELDDIGPAAFDETGRRFVFSDRDLHVYDVPPIKRLLSFDADGRFLETPSSGFLVRRTWSEPLFMPDNQTVVAGSPTGGIYALPLNPGRSSHVIGRHEGPVRSISCCDAGRILASAGEDGTVRFWAVDI